MDYDASPINNSEIINLFGWSKIYTKYILALNFFLKYIVIY